eukprot:scaffold6610_cov163-Amphora_coffeaeformis.AAC.1
MKSQLQSEPYRLKEEKEEEEEETVRRPIPSRQVTVGFRLSVAVDRSQQEMERREGGGLRIIVQSIGSLRGGGSTGSRTGSRRLGGCQWYGSFYRSSSTRRRRLVGLRCGEKHLQCTLTHLEACIMVGPFGWSMAQRAVGRSLFCICYTTALNWERHRLRKIEQRLAVVAALILIGLTSIQIALAN